MIGAVKGNGLHEQIAFFLRDEKSEAQGAVRVFGGPQNKGPVCPKKGKPGHFMRKNCVYW